jgi:phosphopantothenoylcysteine decarboxylase/phosphopantothenate--cysteine ligase
MDVASKKKKILLAVTGSIAAYKSAHLVRLLVKNDYEVRVLMTKSAIGFISPVTLSTLSKQEVYSDIQSEEAWNNHVELGLWADYMIIAPATANTMAKMVTGITDNIVMACYLSARCPVAYAPAMDLDMYKHSSTTANMDLLEQRGVKLIPAEYGELASGLIGEGRMAEPEKILEFLNQEFKYQQDLKGLRALVTAGPTYEHIDPVRFIGNHSSGKMGCAIALELVERGALVDLILGPSKLKLAHPSITVHNVITAAEMYRCARELHSEQDLAVFSAAVADYRPKEIFTEKVKKSVSDLSIELEKTEDIALELGKLKKPGQIHIGFALETNNESTNAKLKLEHKHFDMIVLNSLQDKGAGFNHDTNKVSLFFKDNMQKDFELKSKQIVAKDIVDAFIQLKDKI